jgi:hypothetical protein
MGLQQLSGIDGVLFYAPVIFAQAGDYSVSLLVLILMIFRARQSEGVFLSFRGIWDYQLCQYYSRPILSDGSVGTSSMLYYRWPSHVRMHDVDRRNVR